MEEGRRQKEWREQRKERRKKIDIQRTKGRTRGRNINKETENILTRVA